MEPTAATMKQTPLLGIDELLIILYRTNLTLCLATAASTGPAFCQQLDEALRHPKPLDLVMRLDYSDDPAALKMGQLIAYTPAKDGSLCTHTVKLMDGTVTTWRNQRVVKIPTTVFSRTL